MRLKPWKKLKMKHRKGKENSSYKSVEKALEILNELGYEKFKNKDYVAAIVYYEKYIKLCKTNAVVYNMLGYLYQKLAKYQNIDKQISYFEKALEIQPDYKQAIRNLALVYPLAGKHQEASECFHKLFKLDPVLDDYMAYGCQKIQLKDFEEGWKYYEYRFLKEYTPTEYPKMDKPRWEGQKILDKTLLVQYEQGFGDSIQFCRYLEQIKPMVGKIIFRVQNELVDLMKNSFNDIEIVGKSALIRDLSFDYHIPLMSLPYILKASVDNIPLAEGYLKADKSKVEAYREKFFDNDCFKIGISWSGTKFGNVCRNIPLRFFYPLAKLKNTRIYSFQKGFATEQLKELPEEIEIIDLGKNFNNFSETAVAIENIDLFVTSDNSLFNLSGAMGGKLSYC